MPAIVQGPPEQGAYSFVLIHPTLLARNGFVMPLQPRPIQARAVDWQGKKVQALFVHSGAQRQRCWRKGWVDITDEWMASLEAPAPVEPAAPAPVEPAAPAPVEEIPLELPEPEAPPPAHPACCS